MRGGKENEKQTVEERAKDREDNPPNHMFLVNDERNEFETNC